MNTRTMAVLASTLLLAACGQSVRPVAAEGPLVRLHVGTTTPTIAPQGLPTGTFTSADAHLKLKVLNSSGTPLTFKDGVYAPGGDGDAFLTLNSSNGYGATLLLPAGTYRFQSAVKDAPDELDTTGTLLAYGDSGATVVDATHANVVLKVHAVMNADAATLAFALPTDTLYTQSAFTLRLKVPTNSVGATSYGVPTSDYTVGSYTVTGGTADASTASVLGVSVTTVGSATDPSVNVSVPVSGWVQTGPETATYGTRTVNFSHAVQTFAVSADAAAPNEASIGGPSTAPVNQSVTVTGLAFDQGGQVSVVRLYAGTVLVASTVAGEQTAGVTALTFPSGTDAWTASWTPKAVGTHTLTVVVNDAAGNERTGTLDVTVDPPQP